MVVLLKLCWRILDLVKKTVYNGAGTFSFSGPKIWELLPTQIKELISLSGFKKAIK